MAKSRTFQVRHNRILFKCPECQAKRSLPVPPSVRKRSVRCHKCGSLANCSLNRRIQPRHSQTGKATMITRDGKEIDINLHDISNGGVGFDLGLGASRAISLRHEVQFKCSWNPQLFDQGRYVVKNIIGRRIGVQHVAKNKSY